MLGTAAYLSPEQARGEKAGPPADLYALGVVSYQLLTGRLPYEAASLTDLARMQEAGPPISPSDVDPDIPRSLGEAVMKALHPLPEGRYEGALEMGDALVDGLRGIAPEPTDATIALDSTSATQMLGETSATRAQTGTSNRPAQRTRGLQPIDEPPRRREPARRATAAPPVEPRRAARKRRNPLRGVMLLVVLLAVIVAGVLAYQTVQDNAARAVQLREDVRGGVQDAVDEIKGLIEDNTQ